MSTRRLFEIATRNRRRQYVRHHYARCRHSAGVEGHITPERNASGWPPPFAPPPPLPVARPCSAASLLLWRSLTSHARASSASVSHLPDAGQSALQPVVGHETSQVPTRSLRAFRASRPPQRYLFRGSIPHPTRSLCTLRIRRYRRLRNTRFPAARYRLTGAGLSPAGSRQLRLTHRNVKVESISLQQRGSRQLRLTHR